jgi:hypothetical protein
MTNAPEDVSVLVRTRDEPATERGAAPAEPSASSTPRPDSAFTGRSRTGSDAAATGRTEPDSPDPHAAAAAPAPRRGGWLAPFCAVIALAAAAVALAAPSLRPWLAEQSNASLGDAAAPLARLLTPETAADRAIAELAPRLASLEAETLRLRLEVRQFDRRIAEVLDQTRDTQANSRAATRLVEDAVRRAESVEAASRALFARVRATALLAAVTRLRRDVDAGTSLEEAIALLDLNGPYPADVNEALSTLRQVATGVASMRDLALDYEAVDQAIAAEIGQDGSGWSRLRALFGSNDDPRVSFLQRLRQLAADGRMAEAASLLTHSPWRARAEAWIDRVEDRTEATLAARTIAAYAVAEVKASRTGGEAR